MARTAVKNKKRNVKAKDSKLSEMLQAFLARRLIDIVALFFIGLGGFLLLSLMSHNAADPSWNSASSDVSGDSDVLNWMGQSGAYIADILVQFIGLAGYMASAVFAIWGVRLIRRDYFSYFFLRAGAVIACVFMFSFALGGMIWGGDDVLPPTYGGVIGAIGYTKSFNLLQNLIPYYADWIVIFAYLSASLVIFGFSAAIKKSEMQTIWAWFLIACETVLNAAWGGWQRFMAWLRHYNDPDYSPPQIKLFDLSSGAAAQARASSSAVKASPPKTAAPAHDESPVFDDIPFEADRPAPTPSNAANIPVVQSANTAQAAKSPASKSGQTRFSLGDGDGEWIMPDIELLEQPDMKAAAARQPDENALRRNAELLQNVLADFKIEGEVVSIYPGPVVTLYELEPAPGTKSARVISLSDDIARSMAAVSVRCAVVPGRNVIGIELPNKHREIVHMRALLESREFEKTKARLPLVLGKDIAGANILADLAKMPHLLVAGTTGSGKSVAVNSMILSLLYALPPEKCRFIMIDPKMLELSVYDGIPHLLSPVVTEPGKAVVALKWTVHEMEERYRAMSKMGVRNIDGYNERVREAAKNGESIMQKVQTGFDPETGKPTYEQQEMDLSELPYIVVVVDEFADLMLVAGKDVENAIQRLAQMARAAGIHIIMATQRPSVDVITGVIKANFPTRISFQVTSKIDSRTILGEGGAEQLLGMGDMLYMAPGGKITRVHGPFVSDEDVEKVVNDLKSKGEPAYLTDITNEENMGDASEVMNAIFEGRDSGGDKVDELYDEAVAIVARERKASTSFIQRHLQIGYNRAARIVEEMERQGVITAANATGKRDVLVGDVSDY